MKSRSAKVGRFFFVVCGVWYAVRGTWDGGRGTGDGVCGLLLLSFVLESYFAEALAEEYSIAFEYQISNIKYRVSNIEYRTRNQ